MRRENYQGPMHAKRGTFIRDAYIVRNSHNETVESLFIASFVL